MLKFFVEIKSNILLLYRYRYYSLKTYCVKKRWIPILSGGLEIADDIVFGHAPIDWWRRLANIGTTPSESGFTVGRATAMYILLYFYFL